MSRVTPSIPARSRGCRRWTRRTTSLRHQLQTGELTQDAYEEAWTVLIATVPPAVLKASMEKRHDAAQHDAVQTDCRRAGQRHRAD